MSSNDAIQFTHNAPQVNEHVQSVVDQLFGSHRFLPPTKKLVKDSIVRALEESSCLAISKLSGAYDVDVVHNWPADPNVYFVPQNMPTLLAMVNVFPRSFNGMDTDYFPAFEGAYRLHRDESGKVVSTSFTPHNA